jgi:Cu+-exporting ATPase
MPRDHVCDKEIEESEAEATAEYAGDRYYFHSQECKEKFEADPEKYVSRSDESQS